MKRTVHESEHTNGAGEAVYVLTVYCASRPEREAVKAAALTLPVPAAFQPLPKPGDAFDAYEGPPPPAHIGKLIAEATHAAAEGEGECGALGCAIPQATDNGSN